MDNIYYNSEWVNDQYVEEREQHFMDAWGSHGWRLTNLKDSFPYSPKKKLLFNNIAKLHSELSIPRSVDIEMREARIFDAFFSMLEDPSFEGGLLNDFSMMNINFKPKNIVEKDKIIFYGWFGNVIHIPNKDSLDKLIDIFIESFSPDNKIFRDIYKHSFDAWGIPEVDYRLYGHFLSTRESLTKTSDIKQELDIVAKDEDVVGEKEFNALMRKNKKMYFINSRAINIFNQKIDAIGDEKRLLLCKYLARKAVRLSKVI